MSFEFDPNQHLQNIRGSGQAPAPRGRSPQPPKHFETKPKQQVTPSNAGSQATAKPAKSEPSAPTSAPSAPAQPKPTAQRPATPKTETGLVVKQSHTERPGDSAPKRPTLDYRKFKPLPGLFERVANNFERPIGLVPSVKKVNISGQLDPLLEQIRRRLSERVLGARISFPWGDVTIDRKNRVLATNAGLMRYLSFDALRDAEGSHVQYALQMFALANPGGFDEQFNPSMMRAGDDTLDVYALILVVYQLDEEDTGAKPPATSATAPLEFEELQRSVQTLTSIVTQHQEAQAATMKRAQMTDTVLLMDRLGLLKGGLPKDIGAFVRTLEVNRDLLADVHGAIDGFVTGEEKRQATLRQQAKIQKMRQSRT